MLRVSAASLTDVGGRSCNEDSIAHRSYGHCLVFALADGAGGHGGGDLASSMAVQSLLELFERQPAGDADELARLIKEVNQLIVLAQRPGSASQDMHSTLAALTIDLERCVANWAHVGDTRLYHFRDSAIVSKTSDHSLAQALVASGLLDPALANDPSQRNMLTSALGSDEEDLVVSTSAVDVLLQPGDCFLLCTDGLWAHVSDQAMVSTLRDAPEPKDWLGVLRQNVLNAVQSRGNHDNFSAVAIRLDPVHPLANTSV